MLWNQESQFFHLPRETKMRRVILILNKVGGGDPKKMDLTATICTLIQVVYRVLHDVTNTHPLVPIYV